MTNTVFSRYTEKGLLEECVRSIVLDLLKRILTTTNTLGLKTPDIQTKLQIDLAIKFIKTEVVLPIETILLGLKNNTYNVSDNASEFSKQVCSIGRGL